jgi:hypothetical protein
MRGNVRQLIESIIDVGSGLVISYTYTAVMSFLFLICYPNPIDSFQIALVFTCISIFRSWFWRIIFNKRKG